MSQAVRQPKRNGGKILFLLVFAAILAGCLLAGPALAQKKTPPAAPLDLNAANAKELAELPGIGRVTADAIVQFRQKGGPFRRVEDLLVVRGISARKLKAIRPYVFVKIPVAGNPVQGPPPSLRPAPPALDRQHILDGDFTLIRRTAFLPPELKSAFAALVGDASFAMADPGQPFQVTDVIDHPGLPRRRLVVAGVSPTKSFLHYEIGGRFHSYVIVVFSTGPSSAITFLWGGAADSLSPSYVALRADIQAGKFQSRSKGNF